MFAGSKEPFLQSKLSTARNIFLLIALGALAACSSTHPLSPTPNIYLGVSAYPESSVVETLKAPNADILYVTDRQTKKTKNGALAYNAKRSAAMVAGIITVEFGKEVSWMELVAASSAEKRAKTINLEIVATQKTVDFPAIPLPFFVEEGQIKMSEPEASHYEAAANAFKDMVRKRLAVSKRKDVILFIHGYNNTFRDAGLSLTDVWHFTGRMGVPIFYTWPAANGGLMGYFKDRESGEFTIYHLKETLRMLAEIKELESIHIIAHSRGTDVATTALREMVLTARAAGESPIKKLKIKNLFLAAPDLDFGVVTQRLIAEKFGPAIGQITVYMNRNDGALKLSQILMAGLRFGRLDHDSMEEREQRIFERVKNVNFIKVEGVKSFLGHSYFRNHKGVLSDIAVTIQENHLPGAPERPLTLEEGNFWVLPADYLLEQ